MSRNTMFLIIPMSVQPAAVADQRMEFVFNLTAEQIDANKGSNTNAGSSSTSIEVTVKHDDHAQQSWRFEPILCASNLVQVNLATVDSKPASMGLCRALPSGSAACQTRCLGWQSSMVVVCGC